MATASSLTGVEDRVARLQALLNDIDAAQRELDLVGSDPQAATRVLERLNDLARQVATEVERERRAMQDDSADLDSQLGLL